MSSAASPAQLSESAKAALRERIRRFALTQPARHLKIGETARDRVRQAYEELQPRDPVIRHRWLFVSQWLQESAHEFEEEDFDWRKRDERIDRLRREAAMEIWTEYGFEGVRNLLTASGTPHTVGHYAMSCVTSTDERVEFIRHCLSLDGDQRNQGEWCLQGALSAVEDNSCTWVLRAAAEAMSSEECKRLFVCAPFRVSTWRLLDGYGEDIRAAYWKNVYPSWDRHTPAELTELIDSLLEAGRPRAAFNSVHMSIADVETSCLKRLLRDVATVNSEPAGQFKIDRYYISEALDSLNDRAGVTRDKMAELEFFFIDALDDSKHGIPNLEYMIGESPISFVQAVALAYKRSDEKEDPPEWTVKDPEQRASVALAADRLLDQLEKIPGTQKDGKIDGLALAKWLEEVRRLCREHARSEIGDHCLGQLLAKAPKDSDGLWPCREVCEAMDKIASPKMAEGFYIGAHNSRGAHWRGEGGQQERELAEKYRAWAEQLHFEYPYVGGILEGIAASYDREASWHDSDAEIKKRLPN